MASNWRKLASSLVSLITSYNAHYTIKLEQDWILGRSRRAGMGSQWADDEQKRTYVSFIRCKAAEILQILTESRNLCFQNERFQSVGKKKLQALKIMKSTPKVIGAVRRGNAVQGSCAKPSELL